MPANAWFHFWSQSHVYRPVTLPERGALENSDVCSWEDDGQDEHDVDEVRGGPNHDLSLRQARQNFEAIGACNSTAPSSYAPRSVEHPDSGTPWGTGTLCSWA